MANFTVLAKGFQETIGQLIKAIADRPDPIQKKLETQELLASFSKSVCMTLSGPDYEFERDFKVCGNPGEVKEIKLGKLYHGQAGYGYAVMPDQPDVQRCLPAFTPHVAGLTPENIQQAHLVVKTTLEDVKRPLLDYMRDVFNETVMLAASQCMSPALAEAFRNATASHMLPVAGGADASVGQRLLNASLVDMREFVAGTGAKRVECPIDTRISPAGKFTFEAGGPYERHLAQMSTIVSSWNQTLERAMASVVTEGADFQQAFSKAFDTFVNQTLLTHQCQTEGGKPEGLSAEIIATISIVVGCALLVTAGAVAMYRRHQAEQPQAPQPEQRPNPAPDASQLQLA